MQYGLFGSCGCPVSRSIERNAFDSFLETQVEALMLSIAYFEDCRDFFFRFPDDLKEGSNVSSSLGKNHDVVVGFYYS